MGSRTTAPASGRERWLTLRGVGGTQPPSYMTAESPADVWRAFTSGSNGAMSTADAPTGQLSNSRFVSSDHTGHGHGAASSSVELQPGETRSVSIVLAWYLPAALHGAETRSHYASSPHYNSSEKSRTMSSRRYNSSWRRRCHGIGFWSIPPCQIGWQRYS